jgi:hypothetical protein
MRKMIHVATVSHAALQALARETSRSFQDLIDEGISDLLKKYKRPITLKEMLRDSLATGDTATGKGRRRPPPSRR